MKELTMQELDRRFRLKYPEGIIIAKLGQSDPREYITAVLELLIEMIEERFQREQEEK